MDGMESSNEENCSNTTAVKVNSAETSCLAEDDEADPSASHDSSKQKEAPETILKEVSKEPCSLEQKLCVFCNCGAKSLHGQRELERFDPSDALGELGNGESNKADETSPASRRKSASGLEELSDELSHVGFEEHTTVTLLESTGHFWAHHWCAAWSDGVEKNEGQRLVNVDKAVILGNSQKCEYCKRLGATIRCQMEGCLRAYHFPCAAASGSFQSMKTLTLLCSEHADKAVQIAKEEANCGVCDAPGDLLDLLFCTSCGLHFHGACLEIVVTPVKRAGWQCPECKVCQTCRQPGADTMMLVCDECDKGYHTFCLKPAMESLPTDSWKCKNCRVCSECGSRSAGKPPSAQWHRNYSVCDKCYWQKNRDGATCTICGKAGGQTDDTLHCHVCQKWIHADCDSSSLHLLGQQYTCTSCKNAAQKNTDHSTSEQAEEKESEPESADSLEPIDTKTSVEAEIPEQQKSEEVSTEEQVGTQSHDSILEDGVKDSGVRDSESAKEFKAEKAEDELQSSHSAEIHLTPESRADSPKCESIEHSEDSPCTEKEPPECLSLDPTDGQENSVRKDIVESPNSVSDQIETGEVSAENCAKSPTGSLPEQLQTNDHVADTDLSQGAPGSTSTEAELGCVSSTLSQPEESLKIQSDETELNEIPGDPTCELMERDDILPDAVSDGMETRDDPTDMEINDIPTPMEVPSAVNKLKTEPDAPMEVQDVNSDPVCSTFIKSEIMDEMSNQSQTDSNSTCLEPDSSVTSDREAGLGSIDVCMTPADDISLRVEEETDKSNSDSRLTETEDLLPVDTTLVKSESGKPAVMKRRFSPGRPRVKQGRCNSFPGKKRPRGGGGGHVGRGRGRSRLKSVSGILESLGSTGPDTSPSKEDDDDDDTMHNTVVLFSTEDKFILLQDMCVVCGSFGRGVEGQLLACSQCGQCYHPYCVNSKITKVMLSKGWRCLECIVCEACGKASDPARLLLCDDCDISYHTYCLDPPLQTVPKGGWKCKWCVCCMQCGATTPGFHCEWQNNYTHCAPCGSLVTCPSCNEDYEEEDLLIQCCHCDR
uniref:Uncharacterized protein n=1 Tax=Callorhinchus milii TaxID=7868 RepID=A0A4W3H8E4_CALMI